MVQARDENGGKASSEASFLLSLGMVLNGLRSRLASPVVNRYFFQGVLYLYDSITMVVDLWIEIHKYLRKYVQRVAFLCYVHD